LVERRTLWAGSRRQKEAEQLPAPKKNSRAGLWDFRRGFSVHGDIQAVFDAEPPQDVEDEIENDDDLSSHHVIEGTVARKLSDAVAGEDEDGKKGKISGINRRDSIYPFGAPSESSSEEDDSGVMERLEVLEKSTFRIEEMLVRLCAKLDQPPTAERESGSGMATLDRSATEELDR